MSKPQLTDIVKGYYIKEIPTGISVKITSNKNGVVRGNGYCISEKNLLEGIQDGKYEIVSSLAKDGKVAKLVVATLVVRVVVPEGATDDEVIAAAAPKFMEIVDYDLAENVDSVEDDVIVPYGSAHNE